MKAFSERLRVIQSHIDSGNIKVMIMGLGSVGTHLLDYLLSGNDPSIEVIVVGRNHDKMVSDVNIIRVGALIRRTTQSHVIIESGVDLNAVDQIRDCIRRHEPDFIVNSSRVYSGLKYGSISCNHVRAYGIWAPLAMKFIKNIMQACQQAETDAVVINTSYSDATIPWLKSAGHPYPDFGSGNINHLIPRIKYAAAEKLNIRDYWNIDVMLATAHFHDVVISKEGHNEGVRQLLQISYHNDVIDIDQAELLASCKIPMPADAKRNIMNASSNYDLINSTIQAVRTGRNFKVFSPGVFGEIGGYPVSIYVSDSKLVCEIDTSVFSLRDMREANRLSIALDGVENVTQGVLSYTDALINKAEQAFGVTLPKTVTFEQIDDTAEMLIERVIKPCLTHSC